MIKKETKSKGNKKIKYKQKYLPVFVAGFTVADGIGVAISVVGIGVKISIIRIAVLATAVMVFGSAVNTVGHRCRRRRRCRRHRRRRRIAASATIATVLYPAVHIVVG